MPDGRTLISSCSLNLLNKSKVHNESNDIHENKYEANLGERAIGFDRKTTLSSTLILQ